MICGIDLPSYANRSDPIALRDFVDDSQAGTDSTKDGIRAVQVWLPCQSDEELTPTGFWPTERHPDVPLSVALPIQLITNLPE